jgi:hypothetical protein
LAKDTIKEALMTVFEVPDVEASQRLGRAAIAAMLSTAASLTTGAVLDANFRRSTAAELGQLPGQVVEVFSECPRGVCLARYRARGRQRPPGHFDAARAEADIWNDEVAHPIAGDWPLVRIDTARPVDLDDAVDLIRRVRASADT